MDRIEPKKTVFLALVIIVLAGCDKDQRLADLAREHADRQAAQNQQMAENTRQVAAAAKAVVEADAQARKDFAVMQREVQTEQAEVGRQRDQLESERREAARHRQWDPVIAAAITDVGLVLACLLPLLLCWHLLRSLHRESNDPVLTEILIEEIASDSPTLLLPPMSRISIGQEQRPQFALNDPSAEGDGREGTSQGLPAV
jgi:uncharacterized lipoprotein